jgi:muramoyltetrapeptide carboxypeptidase LdcA involved in peptidoglycan recycling
MARAPWRVRRAEASLTGLGFRVSYGRHAFAVSADGEAAGSPEQRAADFMEAVLDPTVDAIVSAHSACRTRDIVPLLDANQVAASRKPFLGNCDNVFLHYFLATRAGLSSFYGATFLEHFGEAGGAYPETVDYFQRSLMDGSPLVCRPVGARTRDWFDWYSGHESDGRVRLRSVPGGWTWVRPGVARAPMVGGELSLLPDLFRALGPPPQRVVLFWDLAAETEVPVRRLFEELAGLVDLSRLDGMVVGAHWHIPPDRWAAAVHTRLAEWAPGARYPVVVNADLSHLSPTWIVPYGDVVELDPELGVVFPRSGYPALDSAAIHAR